MKEDIEVIEEAIEQQKQKLLKIAHHIEPTVVMDDLWQPNDFPNLDLDANFRYEEGVFHGLLSAKAILNARKKK